MALLPFTFLFLSLRPAILSAAVVSSSTVAGVPADRGGDDPGSGRRRSMTARRLYSSTRV
uniref:Secreted protein n=1 Tax=Oryza rufipogon TaxID=4529 RepID=A0A0E0N3W1_ORYRU